METKITEHMQTVHGIKSAEENPLCLDVYVLTNSPFVAIEGCLSVRKIS